MLQKLSLIVALLLVPVAVSEAQTAPAASVSNILNSINIPTTIDSLKTKAVNAGGFYSIRQKAVEPTYTYPLGFKKVGTWGEFDFLNVGYASPSELIAGPGFVFNIGALVVKSNVSVDPTIQNILNSTNVGVGFYAGLLDIGGENKFDGGPGIYLKVSF